MMKNSYGRYRVHIHDIGVCVFEIRASESGEGTEYFLYHDGNLLLVYDTEKDDYNGVSEFAYGFELDIPFPYYKCVRITWAMMSKLEDC